MTKTSKIGMVRVQWTGFKLHPQQIYVNCKCIEEFQNLAAFLGGTDFAILLAPFNI